MSTLTKEWLQQTIAELEEERDAVPGVVNEDAANALAAMKLALASLESGGEACEACGGNGSVDIDHGEMGIEHIECPKFYTSQPAPVSVPDLLEQFAEFMAAESIKSGDYPDGWQSKASNAAHEYAQNIRAAMLQGAEPVMTAYKSPFEQWLSQQTGTIDVECGCVMTEVFFHWLRVAYEAGNSPVIPDGWVLVPVEPTMSQEFAGYRTLTDTGKMSRLMKTRLSNIYRAMIAAAPQQEVKP